MGRSMGRPMYLTVSTSDREHSSPAYCPTHIIPGAGKMSSKNRKNIMACIFPLFLSKSLQNVSTPCSKVIL